MILIKWLGGQIELKVTHHLIWSSEASDCFHSKYCAITLPHPPDIGDRVGGWLVVSQSLTGAGTERSGT